MTDYYQTLGVSRDADQEEIKKAYRKLAMKHHPDRTGGDDTQFKQIQEAYSVLSNPSEKSKYDSPQESQHFHNGNIPPGFEQFFSQFGGMDSIFGRPQQQRNRSLNMQTSISLTDAFRGKELMANVTLPSGRDQVINVKIPPGVYDGTGIRLSGLGDDSIPNVPRGDIILNVHIINDTQFIRQNDDLIKQVEISMWDAVLGTLLNIDTIDKKTLEVTVTPGMQHGQILGISDAGMPKMNEPKMRGRLLIQISVKIPTLLTDEQKDLIERSKP